VYAICVDIAAVLPFFESRITSTDKPIGVSRSIRLYVAWFVSSGAGTTNVAPSANDAEDTSLSCSGTVTFLPWNSSSPTFVASVTRFWFTSRVYT
jgi:hypothetical protein